jgi:hypothetical protein
MAARLASARLLPVMVSKLLLDFIQHIQGENRKIEVSADTRCRGTSRRAIAAVIAVGSSRNHNL